MAPCRSCVIVFFLVAGVSFLGQFTSYGYSISYVNPKSCSDIQYFEYSSLECANCNPNMQKNPTNGGLSCVCKPGFKWDIYNGGPKATCEACGTDQSASLDGYECVDCKEGYVDDTKTCKDCPEDNVAVERNLNGSFTGSRTCYQCTPGTKPDQNAQRCVFMGNVGRTDSCDSRHKNISAGWRRWTLYNEVIYEDVDDKVKSAYFQLHLNTSQQACFKYCNYTACQALGNLCVMNNYNKEVYDSKPIDETDACREYLDLVSNSVDFTNNIRDWPSFMPWLYYNERENDDAVDVLTQRDIKTKYSANQEIKFVLAKYTADGKFLGLKYDISEIQMCQDKETKMEAAYKFATTYKITCDLYLMNLWKHTEMVMYDLYVLVNDDTTLYPVPVLVDNYRSKTGETYPNRASIQEDWILTRRFFLVDNLSGIKKLADPPEIIRYAESIKIEIKLRSDQGEIYPPLLHIKYKDKKVSSETVKDTTVVPVTFEVVYEMDVTEITKDSKIAIGVLTGVAFLYACLKVYGWRRRKGLIMCDFGTIIKFVAYSFGSISTLYFWILFGISTQWLIFFKEQDLVYRLLPTQDQQQFFIDILIVAFVFKLFDLAHLMISQLSIDIFFIDWERPRGTIMQPGQSGENKGTLAPVSIWRTFFVANEWNEIQTMRKINPYFQIFAVLFFLKIAGFEHLTTSDPMRRFSVNVETDYIGQSDPVLRFAVLAILYLCVACVQWVFFAFIYERFIGDVLGDFVDLCSMSNVSIFIMQNSLFGYYIHGRSVHGRADTDMMEMSIQLKREEEDLCGKRGLEPNSEKQTFEMLLPTGFRQQYDKYLEPLQSREHQMQRRNVPPGGGGEFRLSPAAERSIQAYFTLNKYMSAFIDHSLREIDYVIKDKFLLERVLDVELNDPPINKAVFFNDDGRSFNSVLFYGNEWTLLLFDLLLFAIIDLLAQDYLLAAIITFLVSKILVVVRNGMGRRNLASKTLVDERFLI